MIERNTMQEFYHATNKQEPLEEIRFVPGLPQYDTDDYLTRYSDMYRSQGWRLEELLFTTLPGGTYDALLAALLERKRSMFRVLHYNDKVEDNE
jgi:hypothetical protein